jgi:hypothetical protein
MVAGFGGEDEGLFGSIMARLLRSVSALMSAQMTAGRLVLVGQANVAGASVLTGTPVVNDAPVQGKVA